MAGVQEREGSIQEQPEGLSLLYPGPQAILLSLLVPCDE